jgi:hypothetical protein
MRPAARRFYLDTSAYLCILLGESGHAALEAEVGGSQLVSSMLLILEANRNLVRLSRAGQIPSTALHSCLEQIERDLEAFVLRDLTLDLCRGTTFPVVSTPRSLDMIHLRTALWFHDKERLTRFITLDVEQAQAATELGLPI